MGRCVSCCFRLLEECDEVRGSDCEDETELWVRMMLAMSRPTSASSENTYGYGVEGRGGCAPARGGGGGERDRKGLDGGDFQYS